MKRFLRLLPALLLLASPSLAHAYDFEVDGIFYNITDSALLTVSVTYETGGQTGYNSYSGDVIIPESVNYIDNSYTVTAIGNRAFYDCKSLTSVSIPESVTEIGNYAFYYCTSLTSIVLPDGVTTISSNAFQYCTSLTSINIPDGVTTISSNVFGHCTSLTSIVLPDGVTTISSNAFQYCTSLTSINIPDGVTSIGQCAFMATNLTSVVIPEGVTQLQHGTFWECSNLKRVVINDNVTSLGSYVFRECDSLANLIIGKGVQSIGSYAFYGCSNLKQITLPENLETISDYAFDGCYISLIYSLNPEPPTCASTNCFNSTTYKTYNHSVFVPTGADSAYNAAEVWEDFAKIASGDDVCPTYDFCVDGIYYKITDEGNYEVGVSLATLTYNNYTGDIIIPDSVTYCDQAYRVTSIQWRAFYNCDELTSIDMAESITSIEADNVFGWCENLLSINIPAEVVSIPEYTFYYCSSLTSIDLPDGLTTLGDHAFYGCSSLKSIDIPDQVTSIEAQSFYGCSNLTSVNIGESVSNIGTYAFYKCDTLTDIYSCNTTPPTCASTNCFTNYDATLHVPTESKETYNSTYVWKDFTSIVGDIDTAVESITADGEEAQPTGYYSLSGQRLDTPAEGAVTIIRYSDGTARKVFMK